MRIHNTNTDNILIADVPVRDGRAVVGGNYVVPGVPGSGAEIAMNWSGTVGATTGRLLPTGRPLDDIMLESGRRLGASLVDAANPCVWVRGSDFGLDGSESQAQINGDPALRAAMAEVRAKAAVLFGFAPDWRTADTRSPGLPMVGLVSAPVDYLTLNGAQVRAGEMDLRLHLFFMGQLHESIAGTGSICLAAAARTPGSLVHQLTVTRGDDLLRVGHPSGVTPARVVARTTAEPPFVTFQVLDFSRTSRRLMDGRAYLPEAH